MKEFRLKDKIFLAFLVYATVSFAVSFVSFWLFQRMEKAEETHLRVQELYVEVLYALQEGEKFLIYETDNEDYFENKESGIRKEQKKHLFKASSLSEELDSINRSSALSIGKELDMLAAKLHSYDSIFHYLESKILERGYKGHGLTGEMRSRAHALEEMRLLRKEDILSVRRYEKDYFISHDHRSVRRHKQLCDSLSTALSLRGNTIRLLSVYSTLFRQIAALDSEIGVEHDEGLHQLLRQSAAEIETVIQIISQRSKDRKEKNLSRIRTITVAIVTVSVILTLFLSVSFKFVNERND